MPRERASRWSIHRPSSWTTARRPPARNRRPRSCIGEGSHTSAIAFHVAARRRPLRNDNRRGYFQASLHANDPRRRLLVVVQGSSRRRRARLGRRGSLQAIGTVSRAAAAGLPPHPVRNPHRRGVRRDCRPDGRRSRGRGSAGRRQGQRLASRTRSQETLLITGRPYASHGPCGTPPASHPRGRGSGRRTA
jgi:hypothetical protein